MNQMIEDAEKEHPTLQQKQKYIREFSDALSTRKNLFTQESVYDREYYFDEGLGESLDEHL